MLLEDAPSRRLFLPLLLPHISWNGLNKDEIWAKASADACPVSICPLRYAVQILTGEIFLSVLQFLAQEDYVKDRNGGTGLTSLEPPFLYFSSIEPSHRVSRLMELMGRPLATDCHQILYSNPIMPVSNRHLIQANLPPHFNVIAILRTVRSILAAAVLSHRPGCIRRARS